MEFYPVLRAGASPAPGDDDGGQPAGMVAVRPADLARPGRGGTTAVLARSAAAGLVVSGEPLVFCHQVTVAPAVVRRGGEVQAAGGCLIMSPWVCWRPASRPGRSRN